MLQRQVNRAAFIWMMGYSAFCYAATSSFADELAIYDWISLLCAAGAGLFGGLGRTIFTLAREGAFVGNPKMLILKDLVVAVIGGMVAFLIIEAYNYLASVITFTSLPVVAMGLRSILILWAGFSRGRWFGVIDRLATDVITRASTKIRGGVGSDAPPSVAAPLGEK